MLLFDEEFLCIIRHVKINVFQFIMKLHAPAVFGRLPLQLTLERNFEFDCTIHLFLFVFISLD